MMNALKAMVAEINAIEHRPMYMNDYVEQLDAVLSSGNHDFSG